MSHLIKIYAVCKLSYIFVSGSLRVKRRRQQGSGQPAQLHIMYMKSNYRKVICLRKTGVSVVERISVCNVVDKLAGHGKHCLPFSYTNDVINMLA